MAEPAPRFPLSAAPMTEFIETQQSVAPTRLCLTCRTALAGAETCDHGELHSVVDLTTEGGCRTLFAEVWGPPSRQRQLAEIARAGKTGSGVGVALDLLNCGFDGPADGILGAILIAILVILAAGALFMLGAYVIARIRDARQRRQLLRPYGAVVQPSRYGLRRQRAGVAEGTSLPSPLRGEDCLAFGIFLRSARPASGSGGVLWQEMATTGMRIHLEDGQVVHIPAGRIRLIPDRTRTRKVVPDDARARLPGPLGVVVPGELPYVPFDEALEQVIRPGDRVALLSPVELREDPTATRSSLREAAPTVLVPRGIPVLRLDVARAS